MLSNISVDFYPWFLGCFFYRFIFNIESESNSVKANDDSMYIFYAKSQERKKWNEIEMGSHGNKSTLILKTHSNIIYIVNSKHAWKTKTKRLILLILMIACNCVTSASKLLKNRMIRFRRMLYAGTCAVVTKNYYYCLHCKDSAKCRKYFGTFIFLEIFIFPGPSADEWYQWDAHDV